MDTYEQAKVLDLTPEQLAERELEHQQQAIQRAIATAPANRRVGPYPFHLG